MNKSFLFSQHFNKSAKKCSPNGKLAISAFLEMQPKRELRIWRRALPYPPNLTEHHLMLPSLKQYFIEKNAIENPVKLIDIGLQTENKQVSRRELKSTEKKSLLNLELKSEEEILQLLNTKTEIQVFNYKSFSQKWALSKAGQEAAINLAHHYGIYRDLFSSPSQIPVDEKLPTLKIFDYYPRKDIEMVNFAGEWYPGTRRIKYPEPKPIYYFHSVAPVYAEFVVSENEYIPEDDEAIEQLTEDALESPKSDDNLEISRIYKGNIIRPQFARYKPNMVIDARNIGHGNTDSNTTIDVNASGIRVIGDDSNYYTVSLLSLDHLFGDSKPLCHWQVTNIKNDPNSQSSNGEEVVSYLPVFGIRGLGYHRYVLLVCRHEKPLNLTKIQDFDLKKRLFDPLEFVNKENATPVGLSWFQTTWDHSCQHIFHKILNMRAPVYEWIQPEAKLEKQVQYPQKIAFNVYLDHYRDPKEINKSVVLERLKSIHPFEYEKDIEPRKLPANIYPYSWDSPDWMKSIRWKRANRFGVFRHLRPVSALKPLENNADLDKPFWPPTAKLELPMLYPRFKRMIRPLRETRWSLPPQEHPSTQIYGEDIHETRANEEKEERETRKNIV